MLLIAHPIQSAFQYGLTDANDGPNINSHQPHSAARKAAVPQDRPLVSSNEPHRPARSKRRCNRSRPRADVMSAVSTCFLVFPLAEYYKTVFATLDAAGRPDARTTQFTPRSDTESHDYKSKTARSIISSLVIPLSISQKSEAIVALTSLSNCMTEISIRRKPSHSGI